MHGVTVSIGPWKFSVATHRPHPRERAHTWTGRLPSEPVACIPREQYHMLHLPVSEIDIDVSRRERLGRARLCTSMPANTSSRGSRSEVDNGITQKLDVELESILLLLRQLRFLWVQFESSASLVMPAQGRNAKRLLFERLEVDWELFDKLGHVG